MYLCSCIIPCVILLVFFYAVVRQISMLFIDSRDSVFCLFACSSCLWTCWLVVVIVTGILDSFVQYFLVDFSVVVVVVVYIIMCVCDAGVPECVLLHVFVLLSSHFYIFHVLVKQSVVTAHTSQQLPHTPVRWPCSSLYSTFRSAGLA